MKRLPVRGSLPTGPQATPESEAVFASAAELFKLMATPIRLKIISALCGQEKNVTQLLQEINTTQPNMSQHLAALHRAGVVAKRREATQIHYRIGSERAATLCRAVCMQIALDGDSGGTVHIDSGNNSGNNSRDNSVTPAQPLRSEKRP